MEALIIVVGVAGFALVAASIPFVLLWDFVSAYFDLPGGILGDPPKPKKKKKGCSKYRQQDPQ